MFPFALWPQLYDIGYSNLKVNPARIGVAGETKASLTVMNTGKRAGAEVVQLYIRDLVSSVTRSIMELKDFKRVSLVPGEVKQWSL